jgi:hypothetical protein
VKSILFLFGRELGCFLFVPTIKENAGMSENCRFMMNYEYQQKRRKSIG